MRIAVVGALGLMWISLVLAGPAQAHERRMVGPYELVVGWLTEPAFQGQANAASVRVTDTRASPASAVEGLQGTITIEIASGGLDPYRGQVRAVFGQPGLYALDVIPTVAGSYRFRIGGRIGSQDVNEVFESGPGRFDDVRGQDELQYPFRVPAGDQLSTRLDEIQSGLEVTRIIALVALVVAVALPLGAAWRARSRR